MSESEAQQDFTHYVKNERMFKWFEFSHLKGDAKATSRLFHDLACRLCKQLQPGPERTVALRKLLEAKDAAVRATIEPGG